MVFIRMGIFNKRFYEYIKNLLYMLREKNEHGKKAENTNFILHSPQWWRRPESNRCPNISVESFLHVYFRIACREGAGTEHTNIFLRRIVLSHAHFVAGQHPLFVLSRRRHWKVAILCGGPNDYLITD